MEKRILDVCCGSRMFWFDKENPNTCYMDNRQLEDVLCDGRKLEVKPDIVADFRNIPFEDNSFYLVVFDPPHLKNIGDKAFMSLKYGRLNKETWKEDIRQGFKECMRVLKPNGILIFKWNTHDIKVNEIIQAIGVQPLFGHKTRATKRNSTHWFCFMKEGE